MNKDYDERFHPGDPDRVVVAFAGGELKTYQWAPTLARLAVSHVLFRCSRQVFYRDGILGIGDRAATVDYLKCLKQTRRVTVCGVSSGSYGAFLYGQLAEVDEIIAISPLSSRSQPIEDLPQEYHHRVIDPVTQAPDLRQFFPNGPIPKVRAFVSNGDSCELDRLMAARLGVKDITLIPGHEHRFLARHMRDVGMLDELLR